jgi:hypothetical protein
VIEFMQVQGAAAVANHQQLVDMHKACVKSWRTGVDMVQRF